VTWAQNHRGEILSFRQVTKKYDGSSPQLHPKQSACTAPEIDQLSKSSKRRNEPSLGCIATPAEKALLTHKSVPPKKKKKRVQHRSPRSIADCRRTQMNSTAAMPHFRLDPPKLRRVTHTTPGNEQHASIDKQRWRRGQCGSPATSTRPEIPRRRARHLLLPLSLSPVLAPPSIPSLPPSRPLRSPRSIFSRRPGLVPLARTFSGEIFLPSRK
jgi:hypothetical protein